MIKKLIFIQTMLFSFATQAALVPVGVQQNILYDTVVNDWGWDLLYRGDYNQSLSFNDMFDGHQDYVMLGAIEDNTNTIKLLAAIQWDDFLTHTPHNETNVFNGAEWYHNGGSLGFAPLGSTISQSSADINASSWNIEDATSELRLSWHTSGGYGSLASRVNGGWRAGEVITLNNSTEWDRVVFTANVAAVPEPETYAMFLAGLGLMGYVSRKKKT